MLKMFFASSRMMTLKDLFTTLLKDPQAGPVASELLVSNKGRAHESARARARRIFGSVMKEVSSIEDQLETDGQRLNGMQCAAEYPDAFERLMPDIESLIQSGPAFNGPELAWKALLKIAAAALSPGDGSEIDVDRDEEENDHFHEQIDEHMLTICQAQALSEDTTWLGQARRDELLKLKKRAKYTDTDLPNERYALTLDFLDNSSRRSAQ